MRQLRGGSLSDSGARRPIQGGERQAVLPVHGTHRSALTPDRAASGARSDGEQVSDQRLGRRGEAGAFGGAAPGDEGEPLGGVEPDGFRPLVGTRLTDGGRGRRGGRDRQRGRLLSMRDAGMARRLRQAR